MSFALHIGTASSSYVAAFVEHTATSPSLHEPPYETCLAGSKRTRFVPLRPCDLPPPPVEEPPR